MGDASVPTHRPHRPRPYAVGAWHRWLVEPNNNIWAFSIMLKELCQACLLKFEGLMAAFFDL
jgi:hypothetical protein